MSTTMTALGQLSSLGAGFEFFGQRLRMHRGHPRQRVTLRKTLPDGVGATVRPPRPGAKALIGGLLVGAVIAAPIAIADAHRTAASGQ
jgi:hypothetical protein